MKMYLSLIVLVLALVSINLQAASSTPPAPLPEFMNQQQLDKWNADKASAVQAVVKADAAPEQFYTGKPYVADAGGYVYKYRTYNPEMSRWTSTDPSGFPDGVNNEIYAKAPLSSFDPDGFTTYTTIVAGPAPGSANTGTGAYGGVNYTPTGGSAGTYTATAISELSTNIPGTSVNETVTSGWIYAQNYAYLATTSNSGTNQLLSTGYESFNISMDSSGKITITVVAPGSPNTSNGTLINTGTIVSGIQGNGTTQVTLTWQAAATGAGVASAQATMVFTAE